MARATFTSLKRPDPDLFVVRVEGQLGTREKGAIEGLIRRCREAGKSKVIFEFSGLESLGGSVASLLGSFASELSGEGHPPWFVGASDVVRSFMESRFDGGAPRFAPSLAAAEASLSGQAPSPPPEPSSEPEVVASTEPQPVEAVTEDVSATVQQVLTEAEAPPEPLRPRNGYLTLAQAAPQLKSGADLGGLKPVLAGLLHGADLAQECRVFTPIEDRLIETDDPELWFPAAGTVARMLAERAAPVPMIDLAEAELDGHEGEMLARVNAQMAVPVVVENALAGMIFVRKEQVGEEYGPSEELALDLLARQLSGAGDPPSTSRPKPQEAERQMRQQLRRQQSLVRIARDFHEILDEERLLNLLLTTLLSELGVRAAAYFALEGDKLQPVCARGKSVDELPTLEAPGSETLGGWRGLVRADQPPGGLRDLLEILGESGLEQAAPLRGNQGTLGILALGPRRNGGEDLDGEYLEHLLGQAAQGVEHARLVQHLHGQTLRVARTLMAFIEKRTGEESTAGTELVSNLVQSVAQAMNYPCEQIRDLLYGTVLRDIGMIEISDLVLRSPRSLTPEEWKLVQRHPITGVDILRAMDFSDITCDVVLHHHERYNGEGYPHGLRGAAIPLGARIVAVVESYVAMTRDLPYRAALSQVEAMAVLKENWEMRYDPTVVEAFLGILDGEPASDEEAPAPEPRRAPRTTRPPRPVTAPKPDGKVETDESGRLVLD